MNESKKIVGELKKKLAKKEARYNKIKGNRLFKTKALSKVVKNLEAKIAEEKSFIATCEKWIADIEQIKARTPEEEQKLNNVSALVQDTIENYAKEKKKVVPDNILSSVNGAIQEVTNDTTGKNLKYSDEAYKSIYGDRVEEIKKELKSLEKMEKYDLTNTTAKKMAKLKAELKFLEQEQDDYYKRDKSDKELEEKLAKLDNQHDDNVDRKKALEDQKKHLEEIKDTLASRRSRNKVAKEIKRIDKRLAELKVKEIRLMNNQKSLMYPKYKANLKRQRILAKAQGKIDYYEEKNKVNSELMKMLDPDKAFDRLKANIYSNREAKYLKKIENSQAILEQLKADPKVSYNGARRIVMQKTAVQADTPPAQTRSR